jgi:hypothetical protein
VQTNPIQTEKSTGARLKGTSNYIKQKRRIHVGTAGDVQRDHHFGLSVFFAHVSNT